MDQAATQRERVRTDDEIFATLDTYELQWRDRQEILESHGYMLRPRYRRNWSPSWRGSGKHPIFFEDSIALPAREHLIDATRISDGTLVYLKRVRTGDNESRIATMLSSQALRDDPMNHCVPVLDLFQDSDDPSISYMVMPFLRLIDDPPFQVVDEVVDFADQILEGLLFIHNQGVSHLDCTYKNIMMDANALYPQGFHPVWAFFLPDAKTPARPLPRTSASIKYYYVDFGISVFIPPEHETKLVTGVAGRDQEVPELSATVPYDPFKVDIFIIGNLFRRKFYDTFSNVDFLMPIISAMVHPDPGARPDAAGALAQWRLISGSLTRIQRRWRLKSRDDTWAERLFLDCVTLMAVCRYFGGRLVSWSTDLQG